MSENKTAEGETVCLNDLLCAGSATLTKADLIENPGIVPVEQWFLAKLKGRGAPVLGTVSLKLDDRYEYERRDDFDSGNTVFSWKPLST